MLGALVAFITRCITPTEAYRRVNWNIWLLIASMLALGQAMEISGLAHLIAEQIVSLVGQRIRFCCWPRSSSSPCC